MWSLLGSNVVKQGDLTKFYDEQDINQQPVTYHHL